jgi:hypothetical protein
VTDKLFDKFEIGDRVRVLSEDEGNTFGTASIGGLAIGMEGELVAIGMKKGTAQQAHIKWGAGVTDGTHWYTNTMLGLVHNAKKNLTGVGLRWHNSFDESANRLYDGLADEYKKHLENLARQHAGTPNDTSGDNVS